MNWILLYLLCFLALLIVLMIGTFLNNQAISCFNYYKEQESIITSKELAGILIKQNNLRNLGITTLKAKKTNYYSAKYNVIKFSPETVYSKNLKDLAICAKLTNQAKNQQYKYISATLNFIGLIISKVFSFLFIPTVLICAILNISFGLEEFAYTVTFIILVCYFVTFLLQFVLYFINSSKTKKVRTELKNTKAFEEQDLSAMQDLLIALNKNEFFTFTRFSLKFSSPLNPANLLDKH